MVTVQYIGVNRTHSYSALSPRSPCHLDPSNIKYAMHFLQCSGEGRPCYDPITESFNDRDHTTTLPLMPCKIFLLRCLMALSLLRSNRITTRHLPKLEPECVALKPSIVSEAKCTPIALRSFASLLTCPTGLFNAAQVECSDATNGCHRHAEDWRRVGQETSMTMHQFRSRCQMLNCFPGPIIGADASRQHAFLMKSQVTILPPRMSQGRWAC